MAPVSSVSDVNRLGVPTPGPRRLDTPASARDESLQAFTARVVLTGVKRAAREARNPFTPKPADHSRVLHDVNRDFGVGRHFDAQA